MKGIICINKPIGLTSFDVVAKLRKILNIKRIGHSGTLDPMATGVLPIFIGKATKVIEYLPDKNKTYIAGFKLGIETNTIDTSGVVTRIIHSAITFSELEQVLMSFQGKINQVPPQFSAIKVNGVAAYKFARQGQFIKLKSREVNIFKIKCLKFDISSQEGVFEVSCSNGTYIRSICRDLGEKLKVGCVMTSLVRTMACGWALDSCFNLAEIEELKNKDEISKVLISLEDFFKSLDRINLNDVEFSKFMNGVKLRANRKFFSNQIAIYYNSRIVGLASCIEGFLKIKNLL